MLEHPWWSATFIALHLFIFPLLMDLNCWHYILMPIIFTPPSVCLNHVYLIVRHVICCRADAGQQYLGSMTSLESITSIPFTVFSFSKPIYDLELTICVSDCRGDAYLRPSGRGDGQDGWPATLRPTDLRGVRRLWNGRYSVLKKAFIHILLLFPPSPPCSPLLVCDKLLKITNMRSCYRYDKTQSTRLAFAKAHLLQTIWSILILRPKHISVAWPCVPGQLTVCKHHTCVYRYIDTHIDLARSSTFIQTIRSILILRPKPICSTWHMRCWPCSTMCASALSPTKLRASLSF